MTRMKESLYCSVLSSKQLEYLKFHKKHHRKIRICRLLLFLSFIVIWEFAATLHLIDPFFFSSPTRIINYLIQMIVSGEFFYHTGITLFEVLVSFIAVTAFSIITAMILWYFPDLAQILEPFFVVLNSLPKSALAPLLIVWLGTGLDTIIVAGISVALFGAIINLYTSFMQTDSDYLKLIATLHGTRFDTLYHVVLPYNLPVIISNMKVNIGLSLVGVIIGEFLAAKKGLGYLIIYGSQVFRLDMLIASIIILSVIAVGFYLFLQSLEHHIKKK